MNSYDAVELMLTTLNEAFMDELLGASGIGDLSFSEALSAGVTILAEEEYMQCLPPYTEYAVEQLAELKPVDMELQTLAIKESCDLPETESLYERQILALARGRDNEVN
jgi:hypothetical protein